MDFNLTEEQNMLRETVRRFVEEHCTREVVRAHEATGDFPQALWDKLADLGLLGLMVPEEHGGSGGSLIDMVIVTEELARGMLALAIPFINSIGLTSNLVCRLGRGDQIATIIPALMNGKLKTAFGWTEPSGGSDVLAMKTRAIREGDAFRVNGTKTFITQAHRADFIYTMVRTNTAAEKKTNGISCLMIPAGLDGITIAEIEKTGQKSTGFCEVSFSDVLVPDTALIGSEHGAWKEVVPLLNGERTCFSAVCIGMAKAAFADAVDYMHQRSAFGKTIAHFQVLQHYIAEMKTTIAAAELLMMKAAWLESTGKPAMVEATESFLTASQMVCRVTDLGMQIMGGYGYTTEFDMERYWRDARVFRLSPITNEMAKNVIAQSIGMPRSF